MKVDYEVKKNGVSLGIFTPQEICKSIGIARSSLSNYAREGLTYKKEYTFEAKFTPQNKDIIEKRQALKDWDKVRFTLNPNAAR